MLRQAFRLLCIVGAVLVVGFKVFTDGLGLIPNDPMSSRIGVVLVLIGSLGLSFRRGKDIRWIVGLLSVVVGTLGGWLAALLTLNPGNPALLLSFLCVYIIASSAYEVAGLRARSLVTYHGAVLGVATLSALASGIPSAISVFFLALVTVMAATSMLIWQAVTRIREVLILREQELERAQRLAELGSWTYNLATQRLHFSRGLFDQGNRTLIINAPRTIFLRERPANTICIRGYQLREASRSFSVRSPCLFDLLGFDPASTRPSMELVLALIHPDDMATYLEYTNTLQRLEPADDVVLRGQTPRGERWLRFHTHIEHGGRDRPIALSGIVKDVTAQREREKVLVEARELAEQGRVRAEEASRLKSTILANVSHEVRTPLNAILGFADVLAEEVRPDLQEFVQPVRENGRRLLDTLNAMLDLARLRAGTSILHPESFDLADEVRATVEALNDRLRPDEVALTFASEPPVLRGKTDRSALTAIVTNLVTNALTFTDQGMVDVRLERDGPRAVLSVADTGRGIGEGFLPHLFEAFRQESDGLTLSNEGNGLGLAITKQLVDLLGGEIAVRSEVGTGTAFEVRLPLAAPSSVGDGVRHPRGLGTGRLDVPAGDVEARLSTPSSVARRTDSNGKLATALVAPSEPGE
ncbi:MAG: ATP-binding protein [Bacteroidota bacterium]